MKKTADEIFDENRIKTVKKHRQKIEWVIEKHCSYMDDAVKKKMCDDICQTFGKYATEYSMEAVTYMHEELMKKLVENSNIVEE